MKTYVEKIRWRWYKTFFVATSFFVLTTIFRENSFLFGFFVAGAMFYSFILGIVSLALGLCEKPEKYGKLKQNLLTQWVVTQNLCENERSCRKQCSKRCGNI